MVRLLVLQRSVQGKKKNKDGVPVKKVFKWVGIVLLCLLLVATVALGWYFPHYLKSKQIISVAEQETGQTVIMSCNVRCLSPLDLGKKSWFYRADKMMADIEEVAPGIVGFQEVTSWQYSYLTETMPQYDSVITYRENSIIAEGCPIFYHKELYTLVDKGSFWLSETPDVMSKDWGAAHHRICSYVILQERSSQKSFVVFNTHLDHVSDEARIKGIEVVLDKIEAFGGLPAVIMGDFNAKEGSKTYESVTEHFLDARYETENTTDAPTYQGWGKAEDKRRIDYFMISKTGFSVEEYSVRSAVSDGVYYSDHCPIVLKLTLD